ncbi:MAG: hypothetical protein REH79_00525 [Spiroplasma sp.]|nr:hypothetical protein [Spiroplasma sp.]
MLALYIIFGIIGLAITVILLIFMINFLIKGIEYFKVATIKLNWELDQIEEEYKNTLEAEYDEVEQEEEVKFKQ